jgi:hypothetical protein
MMRIFSFLLLWLCWSSLSAQTDTPAVDTTLERLGFILTDPQEIVKHEGELISIEGCIVKASFNDRLKGKPIFLDMFAPYPNNPFSVVIWESNQAEFLPALEYNKKMVRITGRLVRKKNQERLSIELHNPKQINILGPCKP